MAALVLLGFPPNSSYTCFHCLRTVIWDGMDNGTKSSGAKKEKGEIEEKKMRGIKYKKKREKNKEIEGIGDNLKSFRATE